MQDWTDWTTYCGTVQHYIGITDSITGDSSGPEHRPVFFYHIDSSAVKKISIDFKDGDAGVGVYLNPAHTGRIDLLADLYYNLPDGTPVKDDCRPEFSSFSIMNTGTPTGFTVA